jgi:hypothetical protein
MEAQLRGEVLAQAAAINAERLWIEKVRVETTPHDLAAQVTARSDAVADLQALLGKAGSDADFLHSLRDDLMQLVGKLPLEVILALPDLAAIRTGNVQDLVDRTTPSLVAHVAKAG